MNEKTTCSCSVAPKLIFPCSGGSDVGELSDRTARKLTNDGVGKMYCLAGIGGRVPGIMLSTQAVEEILVIDGCAQSCAKKTMEAAGITKFNHLTLSELGMTKGNSPANEDNINKIASRCVEILKTKGCC